MEALQLQGVQAKAAFRGDGFAALELGQIPQGPWDCTQPMEFSC